MIRNGMLICSFLLRTRRKRKEELYDLNSPYSIDEKQYNNVFDMFQSFFDEHSELSDDEKNMKMFFVDRNSVTIKKATSYRVITFAVEAGAYGMEGKITNRQTKNVEYHVKSDDANIKRFRCIVYVPREIDDRAVTKGIMIFQSVGAFGIKTITVNYMRSFFADLNLTLETRSVSVRAFLQKLFEGGKIQKITMIKNVVSPDNSDNLLITSGREEVSFYKPLLKRAWMDKLLAYIEGGKEDDIFEVRDVVYEDIKITFKTGKAYRTVGIAEIDKYSVVEEIPTSVISKNKVDDGELIKHMISTAISYAEKTVLTTKE